MKHPESPKTPRVSVIVPTYASGPELDELVISLDRQTLPRDEWEAIFVDDGSPDDTVERLHRFAASRDNFRVVEIENSGWPSRPRNVGIDRARGTYVAFIDHDDALYADALRAAVAFADAHSSDVVNGKEARTDNPGWHIDAFLRDEPQVLGTHRARGALTPMNPHKLYRRSFLNEYGIRFPEGRRVLWEDIFFNLAVLQHARVVSTMASPPYYHWRTTEGSGSTSFRRKNAEWWSSFDAVLKAIEDHLSDPSLQGEQQELMAWQYSSRLLYSFQNVYPHRTAKVRKLIFENARRLQNEYFPATYDAHLDVSEKLRAKLLRLGHPHALHRLIVEDPQPHAVGTVQSVTWNGEHFEAVYESRWQNDDGPPRIRSIGPELYKDLSEPFTQLFSEEERRITDEVYGSECELVVRSQESWITWPLGGDSAVRVDHTARPSVQFHLSGKTRIDLDHGAIGQPLAPGVWELHSRLRTGNHIQTTPLSGPPVPAIRIDPDGVAVICKDDEGHAVLDIGQAYDWLTAFVEPTGIVRRTDQETLVGVRLENTSWTGEIATRLRVATVTGTERRGLLRKVRRGRDNAQLDWQELTAQLRVADGRAWVVLPRSSEQSSDQLLRFGARLPHGGGAYRLQPDHVRRVAAVR